MSLTAGALIGATAANAGMSALSSPDNLITSWKDAFTGGQYSADKSAKIAYSTQQALNKAANENYGESYKAQVAALKAAGINPAGTGAGSTGISQGGNQSGTSGSRIASGIAPSQISLGDIVKLSMAQTAAKNGSQFKTALQDNIHAKSSNLTKQVKNIFRNVNKSDVDDINIDALLGDEI